MIQLSERENETMLYLLNSIREKELQTLFDSVDIPIIEAAIWKTCRNIEADL